MKIVFSCLEHDGYDVRRGKSFEYNNFYLQLVALGHEVIFIPFSRISEAGKESFNKELLETVEKSRPDIFFAFMYTDEFDPEVLRRIRGLTTSIAWFSDDSWRFWNYTRKWAPLFTRAVTTYAWRVEDYRRIGQPNVIVSQWGVNAKDYHPVLEPRLDPLPKVSFVGGWTAPRGRIVNYLRSAGIPIETYGSGWPDSRRIPFTEMLQIFSQSEINLALNPAPGLWNMNSLGRLIARRSIDRFVPDFDLVGNLKSFLDRRIPQIKARHFEVAACGGFTIAGWAEDIDRYYIPDKEMVFYRSTSDLIEKVRYYLNHPAERRNIAQAARERTLHEHTYDARLKFIFNKLSLQP